jgi:hypothetical protein
MNILLSIITIILNLLLILKNLKIKNKILQIKIIDEGIEEWVIFIYIILISIFFSIYSIYLFILNYKKGFKWTLFNSNNENSSIINTSDVPFYHETEYDNLDDKNREELIEILKKLHNKINDLNEKKENNEEIIKKERNDNKIDELDSLNSQYEKLKNEEKQLIKEINTLKSRKDENQEMIKKSEEKKKNDEIEIEELEKKLDNLLDEKEILNQQYEVIKNKESDMNREYRNLIFMNGYGNN